MSTHSKRLRQGYWLRQFAVLLDRGQSIEEALAQLIKVAEEDKAPLEELDSHYRSSGRLAGFREDGLLSSRLLQLLDKVSAKQEAMVIARHIELQQRIEGPAAAFFSRLQAMAGYFSGLGVFLLLLGNFILTMVLGPISELYQTMHPGDDSPLPTMTHWLVTLEGQSGLIMTVSSLLLILILVALPLLHYSMRKRQGFPAMLRLMPFVGGARNAFQDAEAVHFTQILVRAGVPYEKAIFTAIQMVGGSHGLKDLEPLLGHAAQLGGINEELDYHSARLVQEFEQGGRQALQRLMISAYLLVGLLIGFVVVAAYLPIFSMGSII